MQHDVPPCTKREMRPREAPQPGCRALCVHYLRGDNRSLAFVTLTVVRMGTGSPYKSKAETPIDSWGLR
jgi:hypothetical protein